MGRCGVEPICSAGPPAAAPSSASAGSACEAARLLLSARSGPARLRCPLLLGGLRKCRARGMGVLKRCSRRWRQIGRQVNAQRRPPPPPATHRLGVRALLISLSPEAAARTCRPLDGGRARKLVHSERRAMVLTTLPSTASPLWQAEVQTLCRGEARAARASDCKVYGADPPPAACPRSPGAAAKRPPLDLRLIGAGGRRKAGMNPDPAHGIASSPLDRRCKPLDFAPDWDRKLLDACKPAKSMPTTHRGSLELGPKGKLVPWIVDLPTGDDDSSTLAVCLAHGAGGDASSGNLAALAAACAASGVPCLRFTARGGSLQHRIDVAKVGRGIQAKCADWLPPLGKGGARRLSAVAQPLPSPTASAAGAAGGCANPAWAAACAALDPGGTLDGCPHRGIHCRRAATACARFSMPPALLSSAPAGQAGRAAGCAAAPAAPAHPAGAGQPRPILHPGALGCGAARHARCLRLAAAHSGGWRPRP